MKNSLLKLTTLLRDNKANNLQTLKRVSISWLTPYVVLLALFYTVSHNASPWIAAIGVCSLIWAYGSYFRACFKAFATPTQDQFLNLVVWYVAIALFMIILYAFYYYLFNLAHLNGANSEDATPLMGDLVLSLYFSLVTFTTLGYGDITPSFTAGRYIAASEAFIGSLHMVSFIAVWLSRPAAVDNTKVAD